MVGKALGIVLSGKIVHCLVLPRIFIDCPLNF